MEAGVGGKLDSPLAGVVAAMLLGTATWVERMKERIQSYAAQPAVPARRRLVIGPSLAEVEAAVCGSFGVDVEGLRAARRHGNEARMGALYWA
ncbi:MAG: hypothetical protein HY000_29510, partial [Planctomycetes bacterium]|nr:hypothetical protein [Planctomycetota bacterium]